MPIVPYGSDHEPLVVAFNERLERGGCAFKFPTSHVHKWLPPVGDRATFMEGFVAFEGGAVRGGFLAKHQPFALRGELRGDVHNLQLPLSEGTVDPAFNRVGVQILATAVRKFPLLYALGMGGLTAPLPTTLAAMGWTMKLVPFYFRVVKPSAFLRNIRALRTTVARRLAFDLAAATGLGTLAIRPIHAALTRPQLFGPRTEVVPRFESWADGIWERALGDYSLIAQRDAAELNVLYAESDRRPIRLRVSRGGKDVGWAVVFDTQLRDHKQFGDMRLGSLVDCLALPGEEASVVRAATRLLRKRGVDLIISNQGHAVWGDALRRHGFLSGPSNYGFAVSKALAAALAPWEAHESRIHMTRGDGDGPIHI